MPIMPYIAIGGFQHETNTFAPHRARFEDFVKQDSWPGLTRGEALFSTMEGLNIPITGFINATHEQQLYPLLWCSAEPSSYVTQEAFERITTMFCDDLRAMRQLDAVYLDLHGAMVVEHFEDGEGELLRRIRKIIGPEIPLIVSLDLHANITEAMVKHSTAITVYRTYPHLDMAETGRRAHELLDKVLAGEKLIGGMRKLPFLIPLTSQCTDHEPCRSIYQRVSQSGGVSSDIYSADFAAGFPPADINECGGAVIIYGKNEAVVNQELESLTKSIISAEPQFTNESFSPDEAVKHAMNINSDKPVVLADAQDNPGAGGTADTTGLLDALVRNHAKCALIAILYDPEVASLAHKAGIGGRVEIGLGAKSGFAGVFPFLSNYEIEALGDGYFIQTGDMNKNSKANLGPMALLRVADSEVRIIVGSQRTQCLDLAMIRHLGIEPTEQRILVVKSSVHFRADFDPIAAETLVVFAPGAHPCRLVGLPYKNLRSGVRLEPMSEEFIRNLPGA